MRAAAIGLGLVVGVAACSLTSEAAEDVRASSDAPPAGNCYSYAIGRDVALNPGDLAGMPRLLVEDLNASTLADRARRDGLEQVDEPDDCEAPCWPVALAIAPTDYHWFRREADGSWSHKPGHEPPRETDVDGHVIVDPERADRGPYASFGGFFCACPRTP